MITRLYANNFRCLVAFETQFESFGVLCGPNGAGKSSVFDAIRVIRDLGSGDCFLGGSGERDIASLEFTNWLESTVQEFEIELTADGHAFKYLIHIEQVAEHEKPRIIREEAWCDKKRLFERDLEGVRFPKGNGSLSGFPLDWRQAALASIQPTGSRRDIEILQKAIARLIVLRPNPRSFDQQSKVESQHPDLGMINLVSWYRYLAQEQDWTDALRDSLKDVWPDFRSFKLENVGLNVKALQLRFEEPLFLSQLSDGEKMLIGLYMIRAALETGAIETVLVDEPDNYVGLPELQPWVISIRELLDENHQAILISHHPEILSSAGSEMGRYLWRDNHSSPTRIGPLKVPEGLSAGEAVTRGWVNG
jgi:predicted ATPase